VWNEKLLAWLEIGDGWSQGTLARVGVENAGCFWVEEVELLELGGRDEDHLFRWNYHNG
jgi:hypothetical protein